MRSAWAPDSSTNAQLLAGSGNGFSSASQMIREYSWMSAAIAEGPAGRQPASYHAEPLNRSHTGPAPAAASSTIASMASSSRLLLP